MHDPTDSAGPTNEPLSVSGASQPVNVPVFNCIVYVTSMPQGGVRVRVANLEGLEFVAGTERQALAQVVPAFKAKVSSLIQSKSPIPWIEPPAAAESGEQKRFIPVHL